MSLDAPRQPAPAFNSVAAPQALANLGSYDAIIDARSPAEFALDCVPGAINWPSLDDAQRIRIGTMYKEQGAFEAKKHGAALVASNIGAHIAAHVLDKPRDWRPLVYCWRGGNRSASLALVLSKIGFKVELLDGGYRGYRRAVIAALAVLPANYRFHVVCGKTGSGKTRYLAALAELGAQVLDLEALANHRGSVLGLKPGDAQPSQKLFETRIFQTLSGFTPDKVVYVESESKKVGAVQVPESLITAMRSAPCTVIELPLQARVDLLMDEYDFFVSNPQALHQRLNALIDIRGHDTINRWKAWTADPLDVAAFRQFVAESLELHYDPIYSSSMLRNFDNYGRALQLPLAEGSASALRIAALAQLATPT